MLDRNARAEAARILREAALSRHTEWNIVAVADALEAEAEGYDYETAAAERGEALARLLAALGGTRYDRIVTPELASAINRGDEVMEGAERSSLLVSRTTVERLIIVLEGLQSALIDAEEWSADTPELIAEAMGLAGLKVTHDGEASSDVLDLIAELRQEA